MLCYGIMKGIYILLVFFAYINCSWGLKMLALDIPTPTTQGDSVELICNYELEDDRLYSIKWYKNDVEFYRYVPNDWPPGQFLPLPGIKIDLSKSGSRSVYLRNIDLNSTGRYRCEVSAEAPSFQTVESEEKMDVIVLPTEGPRISGAKPKYDVSDLIDINCTSAKSKPAATLRWYINDDVVEAGYETEYATILHEDGLESSALSLRFVAEEKHFKEQNMRLKCTAYVSKLYIMSNEEIFVSSHQQSSPLQIDEDIERMKSVDEASAVMDNSQESGAESIETFFNYWKLFLIATTAVITLFL